MIRRILVPLDGSKAAETALPHATALASALGAEILLLRVVERESNSSPGYLADSLETRMVRAESEGYLHNLEQRMSAQAQECSSVVREGDASEMILNTSREEDADLIILCGHGHGRRSPFLFGKTIQQVVSGAGKSILILPPSVASPPAPESFHYARILVPVDGSKRAEWALCLAASIASAHRAELVVGEVVPIPEMSSRGPLAPEDQALVDSLVARSRRATQEYLQSLTERFSSSGQSIRTILRVSGRVASSIQRMVTEEEPDLLVLSAHGRSGRGQWMYGGVAGSLMAHCTVPILVFQDLAFNKRFRDRADRGREEAICF